MDQLYNQRGAVYAWLHPNGNIYGLAGEALAFVDDDGVYNWEGMQIGWWADGHMRDWLGAVCLFTKAATQTLVVRPVVQAHQLRPLNLARTERPMKWPKLPMPPKLCIWTTKMPF